LTYRLAYFNAISILLTKKLKKMKKENVAASVEVAEVAKVEVAKVAKARPAYLTFLGDLIAKGEMTQKQLQEEGWKAFPALAKSTITTVLVDSKNAKYSRFGKVAVKDEKTGCLHF